MLSTATGHHGSLLCSPDAEFGSGHKDRQGAFGFVLEPESGRVICPPSTRVLAPEVRVLGIGWDDIGKPLGVYGADRCFRACSVSGLDSSGIVVLRETPSPSETHQEKWGSPKWDGRTTKPLLVFPAPEVFDASQPLDLRRQYADRFSWMAEEETAVTVDTPLESSALTVSCLGVETRGGTVKFERATPIFFNVRSMLRDPTRVHDELVRPGTRALLFPHGAEVTFQPFSGNEDLPRLRQQFPRSTLVAGLYDAQFRYCSILTPLPAPNAKALHATSIFPAIALSPECAGRISPGLLPAHSQKPTKPGSLCSVIPGGSQI